MLGFELPLYLSRQGERQSKQDDVDLHGVMGRAENVAKVFLLYFAEDTQKRGSRFGNPSTQTRSDYLRNLQGMLKLSVGIRPSSSEMTEVFLTRME